MANYSMNKCHCDSSKQFQIVLRVYIHSKISKRAEIPKLDPGLSIHCSGQRFLGQTLHGQISLWQLLPVPDCPTYLNLKCGENMYDLYMLRYSLPKLPSRWVGGQVGGWVVIAGNITTLWLHLASWNLPGSQLNWESKMEPSVAK